MNDVVKKALDEAALSPIDRALKNRPRGNPNPPPKRRTKVSAFPADYDPRMASHELARKALERVQQTWTTTKDIHDRGETPLGELAKAALASADRAMGNIDDVIDKLRGTKQRGESAIAAAIRRGADDKVAAEVRAHFKSLGPAEATKLARQRIEAGDSTVAAALLGAPAFLSGLDEKAQGAIRLIAETRFAPDQVKARELLDKDEALLGRARQRLHQEVWQKAAAWEAAGDGGKLKSLAEGGDG